jgi:hypothetical protein
MNRHQAFVDRFDRDGRHEKRKPFRRSSSWPTSWTRPPHQRIAMTQCLDIHVDESAEAMAACRAWRGGRGASRLVREVGGPCRGADAKADRAAASSPSTRSSERRRAGAVARARLQARARGRRGIGGRRAGRSDARGLARRLRRDPGDDRRPRSDVASDCATLAQRGARLPVEQDVASQARQNVAKRSPDSWIGGCSQAA